MALVAFGASACVVELVAGEAFGAGLPVAMTGYGAWLFLINYKPNESKE
jgi:hypothetical protein